MGRLTKARNTGAHDPVASSSTSTPLAGDYRGWLSYDELVCGLIGQHQDCRIEGGRRVGTSGAATIGELPDSFYLALFTDYAYYISGKT